MCNDNDEIRLVYLCGPIDSISKAESQGWREVAYDKFSERGIVCTVPGLEKKKLTPKQIVALDTNMIQLSDTIFVNLGFLKGDAEQRIGTGTLMEIGMGLALGKKIIAFKNGATLDRFLFLQGACTKIVENMDQAFDVVDRYNAGLTI